MVNEKLNVSLLYYYINIVINYTFKKYSLINIKININTNININIHINVYKTQIRVKKKRPNGILLIFLYSKMVWT